MRVYLIEIEYITVPYALENPNATVTSTNVECYTTDNLS